MRLLKIGNRRSAIGVLMIFFLCAMMIRSCIRFSEELAPYTGENVYEYVDPSYNNVGPFGNSGSVGECWYYNDPETGTSVMNCD